MSSKSRGSNTVEGEYKASHRRLTVVRGSLVTMDPPKSHDCQNPQFSPNYGYPYSYTSTNPRSTIMGDVGNICDHIPVGILAERLADAKKRRDRAQGRVNDAKTRLEALEEVQEDDPVTRIQLAKAQAGLDEALRDFKYYNALDTLKKAEERKTDPAPLMKKYREDVEQYEKPMPESLRLSPKKPDEGAKEKGGKPIKQA
ncbi:hypothetical protein QBC37DRAFT_84955 [Rhypophila decipiens]|uniref:Uncharacterized protein n=1 Tax=Rhypophila decipiens TaxID=261697 RepID=A0AAN6XWN4_9PEZI|nr:hypothetical protein QBC37DRAFT_84955 [Rhypophila decipiens]